MRYSFLGWSAALWAFPILQADTGGAMGARDPVALGLIGPGPFAELGGAVGRVVGLVIALCVFLAFMSRIKAISCQFTDFSVWLDAVSRLLRGQGYLPKPPLEGCWEFERSALGIGQKRSQVRIRIPEPGRAEICGPVLVTDRLKKELSGAVAVPYRGPQPWNGWLTTPTSDSRSRSLFCVFLIALLSMGMVLLLLSLVRSI